MKIPKKLSTIILIVAVLLIALYSVVSCIAKKPTVTEGEFPFSITYELNGETVIIDDVYKVRYVCNDGYADTKTRVYVGEIGDSGEDNTVYILKKDENTRVELWTNFYPDYLMGDSEYDYFDDEAFEPRIYYYDAEEREYSDEKTLSAQGVKLISFEYPVPIENSFVFSHISYFSGRVVLPTLVIAILALVAIIVLVKKEKGLIYKKIDKLSIIFNFIICFAFLPYVTIAGMLIDTNGGGPELYRQVMYFLPSFCALCVGASVALRRRGYGIKSFVVELIGPAVFTVYLIACGVLGLL